MKKIARPFVCYWIYPISLGACLLVIVWLAVANINSNPTDRADTYNTTSLWSIAEQSRQQYNDLRTEYIKLQVGYATLEVAYESNKQATDRLSALLQSSTQDTTISAGQLTNLRERIDQLQGEEANLRVMLQTATDNHHIFEQRFLKSQYDKTELVDRLAQEQSNHQSFLDKLSAVSKRTDITTSSNLTAEKRAHFYEMWDLWVATLIEEVKSK